MKRILILLSCMALLSGCATVHMVKHEERPALTVSPDKATLVIIRDTWLGSGIVFWNYLDRKMIGETMGKTYFVTYVSPGPHYVVVATENSGVAHLDFQTGKIYYLREGVTVGWWRARTTGFSPLNPQEAAEAIKGCNYLEYDRTKAGEDMDQKLYQQAIDDYHAEIKANPEAFKAMLEYKGY